VTNDRAAVLVGIVTWAVVWVVSLMFRARLAADGHGWWTWTPLAGIVLGLMGLAYVNRRSPRGGA